MTRSADRNPETVAEAVSDHAAIAALAAPYGIEFIDRPVVRTRHEPT